MELLFIRLMARGCFCFFGFSCRWNCGGDFRKAEVCSDYLVENQEVDHG